MVLVWYRTGLKMGGCEDMIILCLCNLKPLWGSLGFLWTQFENHRRWWVSGNFKRELFSHWCFRRITQGCVKDGVLVSYCCRTEYLSSAVQKSGSLQGFSTLDPSRLQSRGWPDPTLGGLQGRIVFRLTQVVGRTWGRVVKRAEFAISLLAVGQLLGATCAAWLTAPFRDWVVLFSCFGPLVSSTFASSQGHCSAFKGSSY